MVPKLGRTLRCLPRGIVRQPDAPPRPLLGPPPEVGIGLPLIAISSLADRSIRLQTGHMAARLLLFLSFLLLPATTAFALHLGELAELGEATGRATSPEVRLTTLTDGRIIAAWTSPGPTDFSSARARIFHADGQPDGDDLFCTQLE